MKKIAPALVLVAMSACSSAESGGTGGAGGSADITQDVRGRRYGEVLIGHLDGSSVHVEVYNTYGLNDCPEGAWAALDPAAIKAMEKADVVILNGPRYWLMDAFENSKFIDATPVTFGGLEMRLSGALDLSLADAMSGEQPYAPRAVARTTTWVYDAGKPVYELIDPAGRIFDMQSYSVQKAPQTEASLADLGKQLKLPSGWQFRTRTLDAQLAVTAVNGMATVVQDELANTYQLSQQ